MKTGAAPSDEVGREHSSGPYGQDTTLSENPDDFERPTRFLNRRDGKESKDFGDDVRTFLADSGAVAG